MSRPTAYYRCVYCGRPTERRAACSEHRDLVYLDPDYLASGPPLEERELGVPAAQSFGRTRRATRRRR